MTWMRGKAGCTFLAVVLWLGTHGAAWSGTGWQHLGAVEGVERLGHGVELACGGALVRVTAVDDGMVRVRLAPHGTFGPDRSWALVEGMPGKTAVEVRDAPQMVSFSTARVEVRIAKQPFGLSFHALDGSRVLATDPERPFGWRGERVRAWMTMPADEHYYGLGEKAGAMDRRGRAYTMWNTDAFGWQAETDPLYKSIPFFLALRQGVSYGIFFDNAWRTSFDFGKEDRNAYAFGAEGGELDFYFIYGPHPKRVLHAYARLTGTAPLPPVWALGYHQCRYSYESGSEVRRVAGELRRRHIPADVIWLDIHYQDGFRPFTVDRSRFPRFEHLIAELDRKGFKTVVITDLHIKKEPGYAPYDSGLRGDHFIKNPDGSLYVGKVWPGDCVFPAFTLRRTRAWWGGLYKRFVRAGVAGFWNDMNEPAIFDRADKTMPLETVHRLEGGGRTTHRAVHNVYGMLNARATFEGLRRLQPRRRPFVLTRAAFAGAQRYAATWTGDNTSSWTHLRQTVPTLLGLGLSGYPLAGADIGGYDGSPPAELLTRWIQLGAFTPVFRNHTRRGSAAQEPWVHGPCHEAARREAIALRYRLMPYLYTAMETTSRTGVPLMRPLFLENPEDTSLYDNDRQFLLGRDLLAAPRVDESTGPHRVQLPPGGWYDFYTGTLYPGGQTLHLRPGLDEIPLFVRARAVVASQPPVQHTGERPQGPLVLGVYPEGHRCEGTLYLDDGQSTAYRKGAYLRLRAGCERSRRGLAVRVSARQGTYQPWWSQVRLLIHGLPRKPAAVRLDGAPRTAWRYHPGRRLLDITVEDAPEGFRLEIVTGEK